MGATTKWLPWDQTQNGCHGKAITKPFGDSKSFFSYEGNSYFQMGTLGRPKGDSFSGLLKNLLLHCDGGKSRTFLCFGEELSRKKVLRIIGIIGILDIGDGSRIASFTACFLTFESLDLQINKS